MYIPLRTHTAFSLSEGAIRIPELVKLCLEFKLPGCAITDSNNLFGAYAFSKALMGEGVQPLIGCELSVQPLLKDPRLSIKRPQGLPLVDKIVVLAKSEQGYKSLIKLSSLAFRNGVKEQGVPMVQLTDLTRYSEELILITGGIDSAIGHHIKGQKDWLFSYLNPLKEAYGDRLYLEISRQDIPGQAQIEAKILDLADEQRLPLVATNLAYFLDEGMHQAHEALLCIAEGKYISQEDRRTSNANYILKSPQEMETLFKDLPEALANTLQIAERTAFGVQGCKPLLPPFPTPKGEREELQEMAEQGLKMRLETQVYKPDYSDEEKKAVYDLYAQRLGYELKIIDQMGFNGYFLIVADFINWSFDHDIPVGPGRGSGAGSLVAWVLKITGLDPIRFGLLFERFLNPERVSMPDFDIDFCPKRREEVIEYVVQKYGADRVAQIITFGKFQARMVVRDVGRVLQMPYGQVDRLCKLIPNNPTNPVTLQEAIDGDAQLQEERRKEENVRRLLEIGLKLEGLYRHASTHAAGVVIAGKPLEDMVGVYYDPRSTMPVTQFNMKDVESVGLVKFDFLGLKTLSVLQKAVDFIAMKGEKIDLDTIPLDDEKTYQLLQRMETVGVFQLESAGMRDVAGKLKPDRIEDLIALVALYRPGPMENIPKYIACKHGEESVTYPHPLLEETLKETYGIAVYQEQVMQIAKDFAGYTLGGADLLRRAMGKKIKSEMKAQQKIFVEGAAKNNISKKDALNVFEQVEKFAGYGFNKSHAAAYAIVSYQTAYLKANYPVEFVAASMVFDSHNTDKLSLFKQDLDRMGILLLPPHINISEETFTVEKTSEGGAAIRYGLGAIKNVGEGPMEAVIKERQERGPFKSIIDFARRLDGKALSKRQLENLILSGCFDALNSNRKQLYENMDKILSHVGEAIVERQSKQVSLFGNEAAQQVSLPATKLPEVGEWSKLQTLQHEFDAVGFYLTDHPLKSYQDVLARTHKIKARDLEEYVSRHGGDTFKLAGVIIAKQERTSKKNGSRFAFLQLSDETGVFEVGVFSEQFVEYRDMLEPGLAVSVGVSARSDEGGVRLTLKSLEPLDAVLARVPSTLVFRVKEIQALQVLKNKLDSLQKGRSEVHFRFMTDTNEVTLRLPQKYAIGETQKAEIIGVKGVELVK